MQELRIPRDGLTEEKFIALKAQMRMFLSMPTEMLPRSVEHLYSALAYATNPDTTHIYHQFGSWLEKNGYEVLGDEFVAQGRPMTYYVIRRAWSDGSMAQAIGDRIAEEIDRHVLHTLSSEVK